MTEHATDDDLLTRAATEHIPVIALTDEEITVLDGPEIEQVAPRPWYDVQEPTAQETACQVALRGLVARGIAAPEQASEDDDVVLHLSGAVRETLAARQTPQHIVIAERTAGGESRVRVIYVQDGGVAVEEDVNEGGLHVLSVGPARLVAVRLAEFCDPQGAARDDAGGTAPRMLPLTDVVRGAGQEIFGRSRAVTQISRHVLNEAGEVEEERLTVYAPEDRVVLAEAAQDGENGVLALTDLDPGGLRDRLHALLTT